MVEVGWVGLAVYLSRCRFFPQPNGGFRGIQYSHSVINFYDDQNMQPLYDWHPR